MITWAQLNSNSALPKSLRAMEESKTKLKPVSFPEIRREDGLELLGDSAFNDARRFAYEDALLRVIEGKMRTKEHTNLPEAMSPSTRIPRHHISAQHR